MVRGIAYYCKYLMKSLQGVRQTHELSYTSGSGCLACSSGSGTSSERTNDSINARYAIDKSSGLKPRLDSSPPWTLLSGVEVGCFSLLNRTNLPKCDWMNSAYQSRSRVPLKFSSLTLSIFQKAKVKFQRHAHNELLIAFRPYHSAIR